jgi:hypothetical protein
VKQVSTLASRRLLFLSLSQLSRTREALATNLPNRLHFCALCFATMRNVTATEIH